MDLIVISVRTKVCQRPLNLDSQIPVLSTCIASARIVRRNSWAGRGLVHVQWDGLGMGTVAGVIEQSVLNKKE